MMSRTSGIGITRCQLLRKLDSRAVVALCGKTREQGLGDVVTLAQQFDSSVGLSFVETQDHLALLNPIAVAHQNFLNNPTFEVLHRLALTFDADTTRRNSCAF